ncbi:MAG: hypothetical protein J6O60_08385 [Lachnospiraceae bacterium]|nr:hypothetical protein [Lachnospiraceae bacterium]
MRKRKIIVSCVIASLICMCLTGCKGNDNGNSHVSDNSAVETVLFPQSYSSSSEYVDIDLKDIKPQSVAWKSATTSDLDIDYEKLAKLFMREDESYYTELREGSLVGKADEYGNYDELIDWYEETRTSGYMTDSMYGYCINAERDDPEYNLNKYTERKEFSFATEDDVKQNLAKSFLTVGIDLEHDYDCEVFYLDHNILQQEESHEGPDGQQRAELFKQDWSEDDDAYLLYYHRLYSGLRDYQNNSMGLEVAETANAQIKVIYGKDGVEEFSAHNLNAYTEDENTEELMDFNTLIHKVEDHYNSILDGSKHRIISAELVVDREQDLSQGKIKAVPVWAFHIIDEYPGESPVDYEVRFNAITGKVMQ